MSASGKSPKPISVRVVTAFLRSMAFNTRKDPAMKAMWELQAPEYHRMRAIEHIRTMTGASRALDFKELTGAIRQLVLWWFSTHGKTTT